MSLKVPRAVVASAVNKRFENNLTRKDLKWERSFIIVVLMFTLHQDVYLWLGGTILANILMCFKRKCVLLRYLRYMIIEHKLFVLLHVRHEFLHSENIAVKVVFSKVLLSTTSAVPWVPWVRDAAKPVLGAHLTPGSPNDLVGTWKGSLHVYYQKLPFQQPGPSCHVSGLGYLSQAILLIARAWKIATTNLFLWCTSGGMH